MEHKLGIRDTVVINDFLSGVSKLKDVVNKYNNHFYVITLGTKTFNYNESMQSENLKIFFEIMKENFDYIYLDYPPI
jgi:Mrp family chromosome partitioning ATPase